MNSDPPRVNQMGGNVMAANIHIEGQESKHSGGGGKYTTPTNGWRSPLAVHREFTYEAEEPFTRLQANPPWFRMAHHREGKMLHDSSTGPTAVLHTPQEDVITTAVIPVVEDVYIADHATYYSKRQPGMCKTSAAGLDRLGQSASNTNSRQPTVGMDAPESSAPKKQANSAYVDLIQPQSSKRIYDKDRWHFIRAGMQQGKKK